MTRAVVKNVECKLVQAEEMWTFIHKKKKNLKPGDPDEWGDQYIWIAMEAYSKLVVAYEVGKRDVGTGIPVMKRLKKTVRGRIQLNTDGLKAYTTAVEWAFGRGAIDYATK